MLHIRKNKNMAGVIYCKPLYINLLTSCCRVAIVDSEIDCPICGEPIDTIGSAERWQSAYGKHLKEKTSASSLEN